MMSRWDLVPVSMGAYANLFLAVGANIRDVFETFSNQGEYFRRRVFSQLVKILCRRRKYKM